MCITTYQPDTKFNPNSNSNPNPNPSTKQHAVVNIQLRIQINSYETCCCTVCTTLRCNCHTALKFSTSTLFLLAARSRQSWFIFFATRCIIILRCGIAEKNRFAPSKATPLPKLSFHVGYCLGSAISQISYRISGVI